MLEAVGADRGQTNDQLITPVQQQLTTGGEVSDRGATLCCWIKNTWRESYVFQYIKNVEKLTALDDE